MDDKPVFVVTGPPNKGKSSLVSALINDDRVEIDERAGTTTKSVEYPIKVDGETMLAIWDTPGFENVRQLKEILLDWGIKESGKDNLELFRRFCHEYRDDRDFHNEIEILTPIVMFGGMIVYVVDSSVPYSDSQYLNEIEIIKMTGLPRIAILNPIDGSDELEEWRTHLKEHFSLIKVFNPYKTTFDERLRLFDAFSHLESIWEERIHKTIEYLKRNRENVLHDSANIISVTVLEVYHSKYQVPCDNLKTEADHIKLLFNELEEKVRRIFDKRKNEIVNLFGYRKIPVNASYELKENNVLQKTSIKKYLSPNQKALIGAVVGASAGATVDVTLLGGGLGAPTVLGTIIGAGVGYLKDFDPVNIIKGVSKTGRMYKVDKLKPELGFIIINCFRELITLLYNKSAADREPIKINYDYDKKTTYKFVHIMNKVIKESNLDLYSDNVKTELRRVVQDQLVQDNKMVN